MQKQREGCTLKRRPHDALAWACFPRKSEQTEAVEVDSSFIPHCQVPGLSATTEDMESTMKESSALLFQLKTTITDEGFSELVGE